MIMFSSCVLFLEWHQLARWVLTLHRELARFLMYLVAVRWRRFHTVAYLQQTWWFEVDGEIEFCFPPGTYSLFFRLHLGRPCKRLGRRVCNAEHVHGWDIKPVQFQLATSTGQGVQRQCFLEEPGSWIHYEVGDFVVESSDAPTRIKFSMMQIDCTHTKGGLCVDSAVIYPHGVRPDRVSVDGRFRKTL